MARSLTSAERDARDARDWPEWAGEVIDALRKKCPVDVPVSFLLVPRVAKGKKWAECERFNRPVAYVIRVQDGLGPYGTIAALVHEYAHVLTWKRDDHGDAWGRAYARCYRAVEPRR